MTQMHTLEGQYVAIITPVTPDGDIDFRKLDTLVEDLIRAKVDGICACGTTGQSATLTHDEHVNVAIHIKMQINGRCRFIAAAGSNSTREAMHMTRLLENALGPTIFLHVTGYYNNPPQEGLIRHYETLAENLVHEDSNIILYNVPSRTGSFIETETVIKLSANPRIIGIKEASGDLDHIRKIIENVSPDDFKVLSGECHQTADIIRMGGKGVISATGNVAPVMMRNIVQAALAGNYEEADRLQQDAIPVIDAVFRAKNPIPLLMMFGSHIRLPLVRLPEIEDEILAVISRFSVEDRGVDLAKYVAP